MSDYPGTMIDFGVYAITKDASVVSNRDLEPMAERLVSIFAERWIPLPDQSWCVKEELVGSFSYITLYE